MQKKADKRTDGKAIVVDGIEVWVRRKKVRNMNLRVKAPGARVELSVPWQLSMQQVESFIREKAGWIEKQRAKFAEVPERILRYEDGETHHVWGRPYTLRLRYGKGRARVELRENLLLLTLPDGSGPDRCERTLKAWRRTLLQAEAASLLPRLETLTGLHAESCQIRDMRSRWGSCNVEKRRIWLSLSLTEAAPEALEYVLLHELVHLLHRGHGVSFKACMDAYMPDWRERRKRLNGQV